MDGESAALASTAAATLVALLTTDAWARAKSEIAAIWRRFRPQHADLVEADLTQAHTEAVAGAAAQDQAVAARLTAEWESRLRRLLADTAAGTATAAGSTAGENAADGSPADDSTAGDSTAGDSTADGNAAAELRRVTNTLTRLLAETTGPSRTSVTQHARASGHASVIQVGGDARIGDVMLEERPVHVQRATAADAAVIIQVGRDLYVSDPALSALWVPGETTPGECPFPGLDAFGPGQAQWFFGRERLTGDLLQALDDADPGLILVVGPSGSGKSSLLGAGLLAALGEGRLPAPGSESWPRLMITPGAHPVRTLRDALDTCALAQGDAATRAIIVVDQLEEIFTACDDEAERTQFLAELAETGGLLVAGLRADFYARATRYPVLRAAMQSRQVVLGAMTAAEVRQAITWPARAAGLTLDEGLAERLLRDLGVAEDSAAENSAAENGGYEAGRLPLLAHALRATWQRRSGDRLTIAGYEATGGIHGAIAKTAEDVYGRLGEPGQAVARQLFLALVRIGEAAAGADGEGTADTRRRVAAESLYARFANPDATRAVLAAFTSARLLTSSGQTVEITHEALLRRWPRLREWISEDRAGNLVRQGVEEAAAAWDHEGRDQAALYGGARLAAARAWAADPGHRRELSPPARDFLLASDRHRRRGARLRNEIIAVLAALVVALGALTGFAFAQRTDAQASFKQATASFDQAAASVFANAAQSALSGSRPDTAMEFALRAEQLDPSAPGVLSALLGTQTQPFTGRLTGSDSEPFNGVTYSPDGALIAAPSENGYVMLWSAATRQRLARLPVTSYGGPAIVHGASFSPDSKLLAATGGGGAWLWNVTDPAHPVAEGFLGSGGTTYAGTAVAFSPDGRTLAVAEGTANGAPGPVQLWNLSTRTLERTLSPAGTVVGLAFAGGGRYLVTAVGEGTAQPGLAQLWDLSRPAAAALSLGTDLLGTAAVSPDGQTVAVPVSTSASGPGLIRLWNLTTRQFTTLDTGLSGPVKTLAFSADGGNLAAASDLDGTVKIWALGTAAPPVLLSTLSAGRTAVYSVAFSPDGSTLASTDDNSVALWDVHGNLLGGQANGSVAVAFSPDGRLLAVGKLPGTAAGSFATVELYDMPSGKLVATLRAGADDVTALAFSPDGRTLAVAVETAPGTVQMWNVASRRLSGVIATGQQNQIRGIAFSPDGALLATVSLGDADVRLWSATRLTSVAVINATQDSLYSLTGQWAVAFSPDGRLLAVAGADGATRVYTLPDDKLAGIYFANLNVWTLAFSPVGHTLAIAGTGGDIYVYDNVGPSATLYHDNYSHQIPDSSQTVITLAFEPGGRTLIAAGLDGAVRLWNPANGALIASFQASATSIASVAYSGSTGMIATASAVTRVWDTDPGEVAGRICPELQAPVIPSQWDEYVSQYPYTPVCSQ